MGSVDVKAQSKMSKALADLEAVATQVYGPVELNIVREFTPDSPLVIYAIRC